jgi:PilZ domain
MYANHRTTPRFNLKIPIRIRRIDQSGSTEYTVLSSNVSAGGVYFASELQFEAGMLVRMYFTVPEPIFGKPAARWCCEGRVIYTLVTDQRGNGLAGGVSFQTHSLLPAARLESIDLPHNGISEWRWPPPKVPSLAP